MGALSSRAERAAVSGAARGDPAALAVLYRAHWPAAYRAAWLIVRDDHAAEDLAQEGFVAAFGALERFDRSRPFGPWLRTIVARRAIDAVRSRAARREVDGTAALALVPALDAPPAPGGDVLAAVAALPEEQRAVVVLRHLLELTPSEIAEVVGVPRGTVNSRLRRGLDALSRSLALALVLVAAVAVAAALTAPGRATAEWVRAHLSEVTGRVLHVATPPSRPVGGGGSLPGGGRLLSVTGQGPFVFGVGAAPRQLLGRVDTAAWSPHGRFVVAVRGVELIAVDLRGHRRWHLAGRHALSSPAWSPSGFRVAYRDGREIHVVAGDGTGDRVLAASGAAAPVWQPGAAPAERLATVDSANRVVLRDADTRAVLWRQRPRTPPRALAWSPGGTRLLVLERDRVSVLDARSGRRLRVTPAPAGTTNVALATRPRAGGYAVLRRQAAGTRVDVVGRAGAATTVLLAPTAIRAIAFSPRGDWLAADRAGRDGWDLLHLHGTAADRARTLAAGRGARLAGWCCR
jgi:RNA polymerase sigma-70 factor (ECF subfamily)